MHFQLGVSENVSCAEKVYGVKITVWPKKKGTVAKTAIIFKKMLF